MRQMGKARQTSAKFTALVIRSAAQAGIKAVFGNRYAGILRPDLFSLTSRALGEWSGCKIVAEAKTMQEAALALTLGSEKPQLPDRLFQDWNQCPDFHRIGRGK